MGSEEEEVFRDGVGGFAEEGTQLGGNWMNRKSNRRLRAGISAFLVYVCSAFVVKTDPKTGGCC